MWEEILRVAVSNGLWAVLFCVLLLYQLRDGRARESKYRETIDSLVDRLNVLDEVERGISEAVSILRVQTARVPSRRAREKTTSGEAVNV